jgi:hypothetical protein
MQPRIQRCRILVTRLEPMTRTPKTVCTVNLIVALLIVGGYVLYGLSCGFSIDKYFLGFTPFGGGIHWHGPLLPSWKWVAIVEAAILITVVVAPLARWDMKLPRAICGLFCILGLFQILISSVHSFSYPDDALQNLKVSRLDRTLSIYVWCSHLFYAICGRSDAS